MTRPHGGPPPLAVVFLGTGARWPTPERGLAATVIARGSEHLLVNCGEGTQRQMMLARTGLRRIAAILITHCHADHVLGLPGLLATLSDVREEPLPILGPAGLRAMVDGLVPLVGSTSFALDVREVEPGERLARDGYALVVLPARHVCPALGWALVEDDLPGHMDPADPRGAGPPRRGRRLVLSGDTRPAAEIERAAAGADLLVHEATFLEGDRDLADRAGHSTAAQAAELAARAGVAMLALTHLSSRYPREDVLAEARTRFASSVAPADLDSIEVPLPERGPPRLVPGGGRAHPGRAGAVP